MKKLMCTLFLIMVLCTPTKKVSAGIPVIDPSNLIQGVLQVLEAMEHTTQMIDQYTTMLDQLEDQVRNAAAPSAYLWDRITNIQSDLDNYLNQYEQLLSEYEDLSGYLQQYGNVDFYRSSPYFTSGKKEDLRLILKAFENSEDTRGGYNQERIKSNLDVTDYKEHLRKINKLNDDTSKAGGRMEAIQYTNQYLSDQSVQLLNLREDLKRYQAATLQDIEAQRAQEASMRAADEARMGMNEEFKPVEPLKQVRFSK